MSHQTISPTMHRALKLAAPSGALRRLPGGYWVASDSQWRGNHGALHAPSKDWVGTQTVRACDWRGWMKVGHEVALLTPAGRAMAASDFPGELST